MSFIVLLESEGGKDVGRAVPSLAFRISIDDGAAKTPA
jgi:hypothetical protein